jgi:hypothetical protein
MSGIEALDSAIKEALLSKQLDAPEEGSGSNHVPFL